MEIVLKEPYFMQNQEWWYYDYNELKYKLTDKAPQKAIDSYNKFYKELLAEKK